MKLFREYRATTPAIVSWVRRARLCRAQRRLVPRVRVEGRAAPVEHQRGSTGGGQVAERVRAHVRDASEDLVAQSTSIESWSETCSSLDQSVNKIESNAIL